MQFAQQMLMQAVVAPTDWEDFDTHLQVHRDYMKLPEFEQLDPDAQQRFVDHFNQTFDRVTQLNQMRLANDPRVAPKVSYNIKGTASAPVAEELLAKVGVQTTQDELVQPPLDTIVFDSLDKPNASDSANSPLDNFEQANNIQQAQDEHMVKMAQAGHNLTLAEQKVIQSQQQHEQKMQHAEEMHSVRKKSASAAAKPKPSPTKSK